MERAKQLIAQSQQLEGQYLAALERGDSEIEKLLTSGFAVDNAQQTVSLRLLQQTEASHGLDLATRQQARNQTQENRYRDWIAAGPTANERAQTENLWAAKTARDVIAGLDAALTASQAAQSAMSAGPMWWTWIGAAATSNFAIAKGITQGFLNENETRAQVAGIQAAQERRSQEWQLQRDLADRDIAIGAAQMTLAQDRINIAAHESLMANTQLSQAKQTLAFLSDKFSSAKFYEWFAGELGQIYATFLRLATVTAQHAELQLAFERQEQPARLIKADYWQLAAQSAAASSGSTGTSQGAAPLDPKGITGSARLLQDLYTLDEHALSSERRLLNHSQGFSLARLMPIEFEEFRRTGLLAFATPMRWFDEGFPGHYMRLIKRVRISVAALIPPSIGIRATLANGGLSRVVTADPGMPTVVIRQDPQLVALTSPTASTGVFELDTQGDLLYPFEGTGVDTTWYLELPPAGNPFDFDSLIDVVLSIDYTAQFSPELRDRVVKTLPRQSMGDRSFSIKRDLPDTWYEIANGSGDAVNLTLPVSRLNFPPGLTDVRVSELALSAKTTSGVPCAFVATLAITTPGGSPRVGATVQSIGGLASSRQTGGRGWHSRQVEGQTLDVIDKLPPLDDRPTHWAFAVGNQPTTSVGDETTFLQQLRAGTVDDILVVMTFSGQRPAWG